MAEKQDTTIAIAIIVASLLVAGAVLFAANNLSSAIAGLELTLGTPDGRGAGGSGGSGSDGSGGDETPAESPIDIEGRPFKGAEDAEVVIVEFSEFQCPFCRRYYTDAYKQIVSEYVDVGKVKYVFMHFPLNNIHPGAQKAAEASECAADQDLFWEMHDKLFDKQVELDPSGGTVAFSVDDIKAWAAEIEGLDTETFNACLDSGEKASVVEADFQKGVDAGVRGTPSMFVNAESIVGAQPFSEFQALIEAELS